jgi:lysophospholipid acyltransferase (LPLAT)-like uncharacterized protein
MHNILAKLFTFLFNLFHKFTCRTNKLSTTRLDIFENYAELGGNIFAFWHSRHFYLVSKARLEAKPWAKYCVENPRKLEQGLVTEL